MAVEHFDEGVYASNLWFDSEAGYQYPNRPLYAPPLVPFLIECSLLLFGPQGMAPMLPSLVAGCATIPLVWWAARNWFGPAAGLASAALAATCEIHVLFSRAALTDVLLCFWWLAAVAFAERAFRRARYDWAFAAGVLAGLAWWTKYNGWLVMGVAIGGAACWLACGRGDRKRMSRIALAAAILAATAFAVWSPVWIGLESFPGGYGAVAENHAKYFVGLDGWLTSAKSQLGAVWVLDGPWSLLGLAIALFATGLSKGKPSAPVQHGPGGWMLLVWFVGLSFATPFYHPYPRLALPWIVAVWLGAGALLRWLSARFASARWALPVGGAVILSAAIGLWIARPNSAAGVHSAWQPRSGIRTAAEKILQDVSAPADSSEARIIFVYAEPALVFHLNAAQLDAENRNVVAPLADLEFGEIPPHAQVFLAHGLHAEQSADFLAQMNKIRDRYVLRKEFSYLVSDLVLSDHFSPADWEKNRNQAIKLYRVK
jgi:4-amino-4-deoxy-L-arabinose transferase-like glycosyltransferase